MDRSLHLEGLWAQPSSIPSFSPPRRVNQESAHPFTFLGSRGIRNYNGQGLMSSMGENTVHGRERPPKPTGFLFMSLAHAPFARKREKEPNVKTSLVCL